MNMQTDTHMDMGTDMDTDTDTDTDTDPPPLICTPTTRLPMMLIGIQMHARTHARTRAREARMHARTHAHARTHTHETLAEKDTLFIGNSSRKSESSTWQYAVVRMSMCVCV